MRDLILNAIAYILFFSFFYTVGCIIINVILQIIIKIKRIIIKLPKNKKWDSKVDPIYTLIKTQYTEGYYIFKYSLRYQELEYAYFWSFFFLPIPVGFEFYKYHKEPDEFYIKDINEIEDIGLIYENRLEIQKSNYEKAKYEKDLLDQKIEKINKVFNDNWEKN